MRPTGMGKPVMVQLLGTSELARTVQRVALMGLGVNWFLTWWFAGFPLWPLLWGVPPLIAVALPGIRRIVDESWGLALALVLVWSQLAGRLEQTPELVWLALSAGVLAGALSLLSKRRHGWKRWTTLSVALAAATGMLISVAVWYSGESEREARERAAYEARHRQWLWTARPDTPQALMNFLVEQVDDPERAETRKCFEFTPEAARQWAEATTGQPNCLRAFELLSEQVKDRDAYVNYAWLPAEAITYDYQGDEFRVLADMCRLDFGNVLDGRVPDAGPQLGRMVLERSREFTETAGVQVIEVERCS